MPVPPRSISHDWSVHEEWIGARWQHLAREQKTTRPTVGEAHQVMSLTPAELTWTAGPPMLPPAARMALIEGGPNKPGPFIFRLKFPANYRIPAHWHPRKTTVTVISGTF